MICKKIEDCTKNFNKPIDSWVDKKGGKSKFQIINEKRIIYSKIDFEDCVYAGRENDTKCDYALISGNAIFFIELKGSDVKKGYEQLAETISETSKCFPKLNIKARLIVSKFDRPALAKKSIGYKKLMKVTNEDIIVKQHILTNII